MGADVRLMRYTPIFLMLVTAGAAYGSDPAYNNPDVVANPQAGNGVLLYPGGAYGRVEQQGLLQPGDPGEPIRLRKPGKRTLPAVTQDQTAQAPVRPRKLASVSSPTAMPERKIARAVPQTLPPKTVPRTPSKVAVNQPVRVPPRTADLIDMGDFAVAKPRSVPQGQIKPPYTPPSKPVQVARAEPAPVVSGGVRRGSIAFEANASDPGSAAVQSLTRLADGLSVAVAGGSGRVQVMAYAGQKGDKSSNSRRLSLKRALIVRQLLIDAGIPSDRIDVRAMGGATDNGAAERVDVFLK